MNLSTEYQGFCDLENVIFFIQFQKITQNSSAHL